MSFRLKVIISISFIQFVLLSILIFTSIAFLQGASEKQLEEKARISAKMFATMMTDAMLSMDIATLDEMMEKTISNKGFVYIKAMNTAGDLLSQIGKEDALKRPFKEDTFVEDTSDDNIFDVRQNIVVGQQVFGRVELGLDVLAHKEMLKRASQKLFAISLLEIFLVGVFGYFLGGFLTRRLTSLQNGAQTVAKGDFGYLLQVKGNDELADTANSFNEMSKALATYSQKLERARQIAEDKRAKAESMLQDALACLSKGVCIANADGEIILINTAYITMYDLTQEQIEKSRTISDLSRYIKADFSLFQGEGKDEDTETTPPISKLPNGQHIMHSFHPLSAGGGVWVDTDITHIIQTEERNRKLERDLLQSQKMESIGTLAGGIAHEINTPIQYVGDNLKFLEEATSDLISALDAYGVLTQEIHQKNICLDHLAHCTQKIEDADIDFIREELPAAIRQSIEGVQQVSQIVLAMKEFAHPSHKEKSNVNLNRVIERSCAVCKNEWKSVAQVTLDLAADLPSVYALENDLNQVILNLVVNAAHAIDEKGNDNGVIAIRTFVQENGQVALQIEDNGTGVPDSIKEKIFDPFFTTKDVGKGTGQGLAISYDILVNKHHANFSVCDAKMGGALFEIVFLQNAA